LIRFANTNSNKWGSIMASSQNHDWLTEMIRQIEEERIENIGYPKKQVLEIFYREGRKKPKLIANMNISELERQFYTPIHLIENANKGIENLLSYLNYDFQKDVTIQGTSGEHYVQYLIKDKDRQIILNPSYQQCFLETLGISQDESYNYFAPILAMDFFSYIDIMNSQKTPTIMAFFGLKGLNEISSLNMMEFIEKSLNRNNFPSTQEETEKILTENKTIKLNTKKMFETYGIPRINFTLKDALRASILSLNIPEQKREMQGYLNETGFIRVLNPTVIDYTLFAIKETNSLNPVQLGEFLRCGSHLGHTASAGNEHREFSAKNAFSDPTDLLEYCEQKGLLTEVHGQYKLTPQGLRIEKFEIQGKPPEPILNKIWNTMKGVIPFYQLFAPKTN